MISLQQNLKELPHLDMATRLIFRKETLIHLNLEDILCKHNLKMMEKMVRLWVSAETPLKQMTCFIEV
jgi:hypothetical protein